MNDVKIRELLKKIKQVKSKILVLGDTMLDEYISGEVKRISPEAPVPILDFVSQKTVLGGAGNVAHNLINIHSNSSIATIIGNDLSGEKIERLLKEIGISTNFIFKSNYVNTTKKTRFLSKGSQLMRLDKDSVGFKKNEHKNLEKIIIPLISDFCSIIISDYDKGVCSEPLTRKIIQKANEINIPIYIDPKGSSWHKYQNATCLTPNEKEVEAELKSKLIEDVDFEKAARTIMEKYKLASCLITRGSKGMTYVDKNRVIHQLVSKKEVYDVSGAGDTVIASFAASLSAGFSIDTTLEFSSSLSSEVVTHLGTTPFNKKMFSKNG